MGDHGDPLVDALDRREAGELFRQDLEEARELARTDARFAKLARALEGVSLGDRMRAIDAFFADLDDDELASLDLPPHLGQLRSVYLRSR